MNPQVEINEQQTRNVTIERYTDDAPNPPLEGLTMMITICRLKSRQKVLQNV